MDEYSREDKMLLARAEDMYRLCVDGYCLSYTDFLDMRQKSLIEHNYRNDRYLKFYGGYEEAERCIAVFVPEYIEEDIYTYFDKNEDECPVVCLRITAPKTGRRLSHRDYLGSMTGLGIKREMIGDILVREDGADVFVLRDIAEYLLYNYNKAGRTSISVEIIGVGEAEIKEPEYKVITDTVASLRLDSIVSSAFGLSRAKAAEAIKRGIVAVNSMQTEKTDHHIEEGDRISMSGKGKAKLVEIGGKSRKDRIYIKINRYI